MQRQPANDLPERLVRRGHFRYASGLHGDVRLALPVLFEDAQRLDAWVEVLAGRWRPRRLGAIVGCAVGGGIVGQRLAALLGLPFVLADRLGRDGSGQFGIDPAQLPVIRGRSIGIVDDAINAGTATRAAADAVRAHGGSVVAVGALICRLPAVAAETFGAIDTFDWLIGVAWDVWPLDACPLCQAGSVPESAL